MTNTERYDPYAPLRYRDYRLLLTGRFISTFANEMLTFAISWELWLRTHSAFALGTVLVVLAIARLFPEMGQLKTLDVPAHEPA